MTIEELFKKLEELPLYEEGDVSVFVEKEVEEGMSIEAAYRSTSLRQVFENFNKKFGKLAKKEVKNFSFEHATLVIELEDEKKIERKEKMTKEQKERLEKINEDIEFTKRGIAEYTQSLENLQYEKDKLLEEILEDDNE